MLEIFPGTVCKYLKVVYKQFLCGISTKSIDWTVLFSHLRELPDEDRLQHLDSLLTSTIGHPLLKSQPVKLSYQRAFLKQLLNKAEECDIVHPALYDFYVSLLSNPSSEESGLHYKHFPLGNCFISIEESSRIISQGTTGLCTWEAAVYLADWCISNSDVCCGKNVLELGSGVGLTGLAVCTSTAGPESFTFTDCHPQVLKQLKKNVLFNLNRNGSASSQTINATKIEILDLDWNDYDGCTLQKLQYTPQIVLGADIVYDSSLFIPLCKVLKHVLASGAVAILACTVRNRETLASFIQLLASEGFNVMKEPDYDLKHFVCSPDAIVNIYKISNGAKEPEMRVESARGIIS